MPKLLVVIETFTIYPLYICTVGYCVDFLLVRMNVCCIICKFVFFYEAMFSFSKKLYKLGGFIEKTSRSFREVHEQKEEFSRLQDIQLKGNRFGRCSSHACVLR